MEVVRIDFDKVAQETSDAVLILIDPKLHWIPKSLIKDEDQQEGWVEIPEWFAIKENLV